MSSTGGDVEASAVVTESGLSPSEMAALVGRYADAKNRYELDAALADWSDDGFFEAVPLSLRVAGRDAVRSLFKALLSAFPDYRGRIEGQAAGDQGLAAWWVLEGTMDGPFLGLEPTGREVSVPAVSVFAFRDGLIAGERMFFDLATMCEQAGLETSAVRELFRNTG